VSLARRQSWKKGPAACASACGAIIPALAHEASLPNLPRSSTVTAAPWRASRHAIELPITPPPIITTCFFTSAALLFECWSRDRPPPDNRKLNHKLASVKPCEASIGDRQRDAQLKRFMKLLLSGYEK
jgi:hypothetical protein